MCAQTASHSAVTLGRSTGCRTRCRLVELLQVFPPNFQPELANRFFVVVSEELATLRSCGLLLEEVQGLVRRTGLLSQVGLGIAVLVARKVAAEHEDVVIIFRGSSVVHAPDVIQRQRTRDGDRVPTGEKPVHRPVPGEPLEGASARSVPALGGTSRCGRVGR